MWLKIWFVDLSYGVEMFWDMLVKKIINIFIYRDVLR